VVVGASMGGARAVLAVADGVDAEAWVDLSGAPAWDGRVVADEARRVKVPGLVVHDPDDGAAEYAASRVTARRAGATFVEGSEGHGYDMVFDPGGPLTALGERVLAFVEG
jgi:dienelactone hydrolase